MSLTSEQIAKFFDAGIDDLRLQTLAVYLDELEPRKRQVFAHEWADLEAARQRSQPSLEPLKNTDEGQSAPAGRERLGVLCSLCSTALWIALSACCRLPAASNFNGSLRSPDSVALRIALMLPFDARGLQFSGHAVGILLGYLRALVLANPLLSLLRALGRKLAFFFAKAKLSFRKLSGRKSSRVSLPDKFAPA